ncbi:phospho-2-dehydro-3-deoxyheptonate aldolase [Arenicella chitinivorans]|uniref:Phospho-2-dehydro-3-deoxyheptonate aldolase n=1 Tax=Arenicella chitinivorans TaxID=1329800 RepID=A0A918VSZ5_9GAMM|nr:3-deoxy-7-phosphoheptulonate synthase [Arenicella chitinivorans]GHA20155.1 phospho-2-dehydro-3-deoxyheptonate aldolase [Arenicella chitinivorans]
MTITTNRRILAIDPICSPSELVERFPSSDAVAELVQATRNRISDILHKRDDRLLVITGPCSVHDPKSALEYAERLAPLRAQYANSLELVMRVYFEKPRTTIGWKGLINDPDLNQSYNVDKGLAVARKVLLDINSLGIPAACEFLDAVTGQYYADLVSWGAIGARTTESQVHRELASGLSCPIGFKNGTKGDVDIAADAVIAARAQHIFLSPTELGTTAQFTTAGNDDGHIILRGGSQPNYDEQSVADAVTMLQDRGIDTGIMIDFSHANSQKQYQNQLRVGTDVANQIADGNTNIVSCMIESHLIEGKQPIAPADQLVYGQSITDACIGFAQTETLLQTLSEAVLERRRK